MNAIVASPALQAIAFAIFNSFWQMALLWLIYAGVCYFFKFRSRIKYLLATTLYIGGFVWFLSTIAYYFLLHLNIINTAIPIHSNNFESAIIPSSLYKFYTLLQNHLIKVDYLFAYISIIYLSVIALLIIKLIFNYKQTQSLTYLQIQKINAEWRLFVKQTAALLGIKKEVKVFFSNMVSTPMTIGFFKPIILIPLASLNKLSSYQMEAVLLHELAHIKRYDYIINIGLCFINIILFFNPFSHLFKMHLQNERENSCDDWVLQFKYNSKIYSEALLQIAVLDSKPILYGMPALQNKNILLNRIKRMNNNTFTVSNKNNIQNWVVCVVAIFVFSWIFSSQFQHKKLFNNSIESIKEISYYNTVDLNKSKTTIDTYTDRDEKVSYSKPTKNNTSYSEIDKVKAKHKEVQTEQYQAKMNKLLELKRQLDTLNTLAKTNFVQNQDQEIIVNTENNSKDYLPVNYALNIINDSSYTVTSKMYDKENDVTILTIKRKNFILSDSINLKPKRYEFVISNEEKPDKKLILEVW
jgi:beta-lactamase regulating signal transducer with metallopeptidase domain